MVRVLRLLGAVALSVALLSIPALGATTTGIGQWTPLTGASGNYATTMQLPGSFPSAQVASDSRAGSVGVQSGASAWFGADTPPGQKYGSSQGQPYLNLRPKADSATAPSTTTYTFERPTPAAGWAFVLGDIDADQVQISAVDADGNSVTPAQLGFASTFNYCEASPKPSACSGVVAPFDLPTWNPATAELVGNNGAVDTAGASAWFEPTISLSSLTITFTRRSGFPVYQTWFASVARDITGTIAVGANPNGTCVVEGAELRLFDEAGNQLATTTADAAGAYSFLGHTAAPGYSVELIPPETCAPTSPTTRTVDLTTIDGVADFALREVIPAAISGTVTADDDGEVEPVAGVDVTIDGPGGPRTTTTDSDGAYLFDDNAAGDYTIEVDVPDGFTPSNPDPPTRDVTVPPLSEDPITGQDFVLEPLPDIAGVVTGGGEPLGGVVVVLSDAQGNEVERAVTDGDGFYEFTRIASDGLTLSIPDPPGDFVEPEDLDAENTDTNDFALSRPGSIGGTVTSADSGDPVAGVDIVITPAGGPSETVTTDAEGTYFLDGLDPALYGITIVPPAGTEVVGEDVLLAEVTDEGENIGGQDFVLAAEAVDPPDEPGDGPGDDQGGGSTPPTGSTATLPDSGGPAEAFVFTGIAMVLAGIVIVGAARARRSSVTE